MNDLCCFWSLVVLVCVLSAPVMIYAPMWMAGKCSEEERGE